MVVGRGDWWMGFLVGEEELENRIKLDPDSDIRNEWRNGAARKLWGRHRGGPLGNETGPSSATRED